MAAASEPAGAARADTTRCGPRPQLPAQLGCRPARRSPKPAAPSHAPAASASNPLVRGERPPPAQAPSSSASELDAPRDFACSAALTSASRVVRRPRWSKRPPPPAATRGPYSQRREDDSRRGALPRISKTALFASVAPRFPTRPSDQMISPWGTPRSPQRGVAGVHRCTAHSVGRTGPAAWSGRRSGLLRLCPVEDLTHSHTHTHSQAPAPPRPKPGP